MFSVRVFEGDNKHLGTLEIEEEELAYWIQERLTARDFDLSVLVDPLPE